MFKISNLLEKNYLLKIYSSNTIQYYTKHPNIEKFRTVSCNFVFKYDVDNLIILKFFWIFADFVCRKRLGKKI